jgi:hypothetical protein
VPRPSCNAPLFTSWMVLFVHPCPARPREGVRFVRQVRVVQYRSSTPHCRKISRVRTCTPGALDVLLVAPFFSSRMERTPCRASPSASESPTGPAPTMATGLSCGCRICCVDWGMFDSSRADSGQCVGVRCSLGSRRKNRTTGSPVRGTACTLDGVGASTRGVGCTPLQDCALPSRNGGAPVTGRQRERGRRGAWRD